MTAVTDRRKGLCATAVVFGTSRHRPPLRSSDQPGRDEGTAPWSKQGGVLAEPGGRPERCCHGRANRQERPDAPTRRCSRRGDPLAQARLDEPLGPIVGARGLGFGADVAQPRAATNRTPMMAAISRAVVCHDPFDGHAVAGEPGERAFEKRHRVFALFAQDFAVG